MRLATIATSEGQRVGVVDADSGVLRDVTELIPRGEMLGAIESWEQVRPRLDTMAARLPLLPLSELKFEAPIPRPRRNIFCVGKNYRDHISEFGRSGYDTQDRSEEEKPTHPILFSKATTSVIGSGCDVESHHELTKELDYEGELAVIIGPGGRGIARADAMRHVWGYTIVNDITARDLQRDHRQWLLGKSLDSCCPMGPYAVSADEIDDVGDLDLETTVNGEPRQHSKVRELIFDIPELIATISAALTLLPGDIIATGTPAGVGIGFDPPKFLVSGDLVEVSISRLGTLRNRIR